MYRTHGQRILRLNIRRFNRARNSNTSRFFTNSLRSKSGKLSRLGDFVNNLMFQPPLINTTLSRLDYPKHLLSSLNDLDPKIIAQLDSESEYINKLYILLTYNPISIDPNLYIHFLDYLKCDLPPNIKNLLYRRLIFHQMYEKIWEIFNESYTSLNDIEDLLDSLISELQQLNNMTFGLLDLILASRSNYFSPAFQSTILETICYKLHLNRELIESCILTHQQLDSIYSIDDLDNYKLPDNHIFLKQIHTKKLMELAFIEGRDEVTKQLKKVLFDEKLTSFPGWLVLLGPAFDKSTYLSRDLYNSDLNGGDLIDISQNIKLNELDIIYLIRSRMKVDYDTVYLIYESSTKAENLTKYMYNHLFLKSKDFKRILLSKASYLETELIIKAISQTFDNLNEFQEIASRLDNLMSKDSAQLVYITVLENNLNSRAYSLEDLKDLIKITNKFDHKRKSLRSIFKFVKSESEEELILFYSSLIAEIKFSRFDLLEIMRNLIIKNDIFHKTIICNLFDKILNMTLVHVDMEYLKRTYEAAEFSIEQRRREVFEEEERELQLIQRRIIKEEERINKLEKEGRLFDEDLDELEYLKKPKHKKDALKKLKSFNDFHYRFERSSPAEKIRFHNSLREMGQMLSVLNFQDTSKIITILHDHIYSNQFFYCYAKEGKDYIYNHILDEITRFSEKETGSKVAIIKMRDVLGNIECEAIPIRGCIFKLMVKDDLSKAVKLLQFYQQDKRSISNLIPYIISGIFATDLTKNQKLIIFKKFLEEMINLGYRHELTRRTGEELFRLLKSHKGIENQISPEMMGWVWSLILKNKHLKPAVERISSKIK